MYRYTGGTAVVSVYGNPLNAKFRQFTRDGGSRRSVESVDLLNLAAARMQEFIKIGINCKGPSSYETATSRL